jgi:IS1 family transposase
MHRLDTKTRSQIVRCLVEGNSIRATVRMTGISKTTITRLLVEMGAVCAAYQDHAFQNLKLRRIQCDEIWSFCYGKDKNLPAERRDEFGYGSVWTWTAIDADTKLVPCWMVGDRSAHAANTFIEDLASRLSCRVQLTTDGHRAYVDAVENAFGNNIDFAMLIKIFGTEEAGRNPERRYSPAECNGTRIVEISGNPNAKDISTSYVERQNLTMRMHMRRFTRLTNAFSKKVENHIAAISLHFMHYNFVRIHQTLRVTPAMAAGVTDRVWDVEDMVNLLVEQEKLAAENAYSPFAGLASRP